MCLHAAILIYNLQVYFAFWLSLSILTPCQPVQVLIPLHQVSGIIAHRLQIYVTSLKLTILVLPQDHQGVSKLTPCQPVLMLIPLHQVFGSIANRLQVKVTGLKLTILVWPQDHQGVSKLTQCQHVLTLIPLHHMTGSIECKCMSLVWLSLGSNTGCVTPKMAILVWPQGHQGVSKWYCVRS